MKMLYPLVWPTVKLKNSTLQTDTISAAENYFENKDSLLFNLISAFWEALCSGSLCALFSAFLKAVQQC